MTSDDSSQEKPSTDKVAEESPAVEEASKKTAEAETTPSEAESSKEAGSAADAESSAPVKKAQNGAKPIKPAKPETKTKAKAKSDDSDGSEESHEDSDEDPHKHEGEFLDDPLGTAYDLDGGHPIDDDGLGTFPWKSTVSTAKEFFNTEILYRFDIIDPRQKEKLKGSYRIELKGDQGGIWSLKVGDDLDVVNKKEDADTVLSLHQKDFIGIINGSLNPQLSLLSRKIKVEGDVRKAVLLQDVLFPTPD